MSAFKGETAPKKKVADDFPDWHEGDQFTAAAFKYLDVMMKLTKPLPSEKVLRANLAKLGIGTEHGFDIESFSPEIQNAIEQGVKEGFKELENFIKKYASDPLVSAKIFGTRDFLTKSAKENYNLDNLYILRAVAAHMGLYGNSGTEAIYPTYLKDSAGNPLNSATNNYTITFNKNELPPVKAFWSLTMYDGKTQLFVHNSLDRYLLNSGMQDNFVYGKDGSLTLYIQKESPGKTLGTNWLPAPNGPFYCVMRLYGPEDAALTGQWINPPMVNTN